MSHDLYASWATTELASRISIDPRLCFAVPPNSDDISTSATRESGRVWPISDGVLNIKTTKGDSYDIAIELKRENEGLHGVLTAIGQSHAYINKGFAASIIVLPEMYNSHNTPGEQVSEILDKTSPKLPIGVFTYKEPDISKLSPFSNLLTCHRNINIDLARHVIEPSGQKVLQSTKTQWGHVRDGSSDPHAFYLYLKTAKTLHYDAKDSEKFPLPQDMLDAVKVKTSGGDPFKYLSNSTGEEFHDRVWRSFWFTYILNSEVAPIWNGAGPPYDINDKETEILTTEGVRKTFFHKRKDSIKRRLIEKLNDSSITEPDAWLDYIENVRGRAHSYREDIDSTLDALGLLASDGKPTELGYRFVDEVERTRTTFSGTVKAILGSALLKNANFQVFLHYIYKLSSEKFTNDSLAFTETVKKKAKHKKGNGGRLIFNSNAYNDWLRDQLANNLKVMRTVSLRGGEKRKPFQAELTFLRKLDLVSKRRSHRIGMGLDINWPKVQEYLNFDI